MYTSITGYTDKKGRPIMDGACIMFDVPGKRLVGTVFQMSNVRNVWGVKVNAESRRGSNEFMQALVEYCYPLETLKKRRLLPVGRNKINALLCVRS